VAVPQPRGFEWPDQPALFPVCRKGGGEPAGEGESVAEHDQSRGWLDLDPGCFT
jgi:hypothetical protein